MDAILKRLWNDPDFFIKSLVFGLGTLIAVLQVVPNEALGGIGYWARLFGTPILLAIGATGRGSGLSAEEAAKLRALLPTQSQMDNATRS